MDDSSSTILEMLTDLHGTVASMSFEAGEADDRLDIIEADIAALIPVAAQTQSALDAMGMAIAAMNERIRRLEGEA